MITQKGSLQEKFRMPTAFNIDVEDRLFVAMQDFDFCPNLIKFYPNCIQFAQICQNFTQISPNWSKFCPKFA